MWGNTNYDGIDSFFSNYFNIPSIKLESFNNVVFDGELARVHSPNRFNYKDGREV